MAGRVDMVFAPQPLRQLLADLGKLDVSGSASTSTSGRMRYGRFTANRIGARTIGYAAYSLPSSPARNVAIPVAEMGLLKR
jgi:hypothetical protein